MCYCGGVKIRLQIHEWLFYWLAYSVDFGTSQGELGNVIFGDTSFYDDVV